MRVRAQRGAAASSAQLCPNQIVAFGPLHEQQLHTFLLSACCSLMSNAGNPAGTYPFPLDAPIEGAYAGCAASTCDGDRHVLVIDRRDCTLYEAWACRDPPTSMSGTAHALALQICEIFRLALAVLKPGRSSC